jgi:hypothetical protein
LERIGKLEKLALERLYATANDDEQWSFLFRTRWAMDPFYCPWSVTEDCEFDGGVEDLDLPWSSERLEVLKRGTRRRSQILHHGMKISLAAETGSVGPPEMT